MPHRLTKLPQNSLRAQIVRAIRDAIIQGKFKSGEKIPEQELAEQLGVSRTPIREALHVLEQQGLVQIRPKNGTYIAKLDRKEVRDGLYVRGALEELAVRQALERISAEEWEDFCRELEDLLKRMREAVASGNTVVATELDMEWHTQLIEVARNPYLSRTWHKMGFHLLVWSPERELYPLTQKKLRDVFNRRHSDLLAAFRTRDPETCATAVRVHIQEKVADIDET